MWLKFGVESGIDRDLFECFLFDIGDFIVKLTCFSASQKTYENALIYLRLYQPPLRNDGGNTLILNPPSPDVIWLFLWLMQPHYTLNSHTNVLFIAKACSPRKCAFQLRSSVPIFGVTGQTPVAELMIVFMKVSCKKRDLYSYYSWAMRGRGLRSSTPK